MNSPLFHGRALNRATIETALLVAATLMGSSSYRQADATTAKRLVNLAADILDEIESREPATEKRGPGRPPKVAEAA